MSARVQNRRAALVAAVLPVALLAGCGGLLPKPPERQVYRIEASSVPEAGLPHVAAQLAIATPTASDGLDSRRIALARTPVTLDYFADAEWADQAPFLVRDALVAGFKKSGAVASVSPASLGLHADFLLEAAIRDFQAVYDASNGAPKVVVALALDLVRLPDRKILTQTSVRGEATAAENKLPAIVSAFDAALSQAVQQAIAWTTANPALLKSAAR
jgi:cholesterol transport system auxiliary component